MVLGHEIGHVDLRHCVENLQYQVKMKQWVGSWPDLAEFAYRTIRSPYKKDQEFDADSFGFQAGRRAGWSRQDLITFFRGMQSIEDTSSEPSDAPAALGKIEYFFRSHPHTAERIQRLEASSDAK